jgi:cytoskeletal protein CcmA (bactofilin family)
MSLFGKKDREETETRSNATGASDQSRTSAPKGPADRTTADSPAQGTGRRADRDNQLHHKGGITPSDQGGVVAIIGKSIVIKGELSGDEDLEIDGSVEGDVKLPNHVLKIGAHGKVKASVIAKCVQIVGHVAGNVTATERIEIEASGVVEGDIRAPRLLVQEGAVINGAIEMTGGKAGAVAQPGAKPQPEPARKVG